MCDGTPLIIIFLNLEINYETISNNIVFKKSHKKKTFKGLKVLI